MKKNILLKLTLFGLFTAVCTPMQIHCMKKTILTIAEGSALLYGAYSLYKYYNPTQEEQLVQSYSIKEEQVVQSYLTKEEQEELDEQLLNAAINNNFKKVKSLFDDGANVKYKRCNGNTPLHLATYRNNLEMIEFFIKNGANIEAENNDGQTPLFEATRCGRFDIINFFIQKGANIKTKNNYGETPLHIAARWGCLNARQLFDEKKDHYDEIIKLFINNKANIEAKNNYGETPLHIAASWGYLNALKLLIQNGANIQAKDSDDRTPLHIAALWGCLNALKLLIQNGADIEAKNNDGETPLISSVNNINMVIYLIQQGADIYARDNNGLTVYDRASRTGRTEIADYLLSVQNEFNGFRNNPTTLINNPVEPKNVYLKILYNNDYYIDLVYLFNNYNKEQVFKEILKKCLLSDFSKEDRKKLRKKNVPLLPCELILQKTLVDSRTRTKNNFIDLVIEYNEKHL